MRGTLTVMPGVFLPVLLALAALAAGCTGSGVSARSVSRKAVAEPVQDKQLSKEEMLYEEIHMRWKLKSQSLHVTSREMTGAKNKILEDIVGQVYNHDLPPLMRYTLAVRDRGDPDRFRDTLVQVFVETLVSKGDRGLLVELFSREFPKSTVWDWTEFYVVYRGRETLNRPILVFVEAYRRAKDEHVKRELVDALRHAFLELVTQGSAEGDGKFVERCAEWFIKNEQRCKINDEYDLNCQCYDGFKVPLFLVTP
jgi:hypothetical protein